MTIDSGRSLRAGLAGAKAPEPSGLGPSDGIPSAGDVYARAGKIAKLRYPDGCSSATELANIVREAARELGFGGWNRRKSPPVINPNAGRHNDLTRLSPELRVEAIRACTEACAVSSPDSKPCVSGGLFVCYRCQDIAASAIERATTAQTGVVADESAAPQEDAQGTASPLKREERKDG